MRGFGVIVGLRFRHFLQQCLATFLLVLERSSTALKAVIFCNNYKYPTRVTGKKNPDKEPSQTTCEDVSDRMKITVEAKRLLDLLRGKLENIANTHQQTVWSFCFVGIVRMFVYYNFVTQLTIFQLSVFSAFMYISAWEQWSWWK